MTPSPHVAPEELAGLAVRIGRGDRTAEEEFARRFQGRVLAMLRARLWDQEAARELSGDVLMAAIQALREGKLREPERLAAFTHGIARNMVNNHLRKRAARPREEPLDPEALVADPRADVVREGRLELVRKAVAQLEPTDHRIVTALAEGLRSVEIAARLGLTAETVRARKHRALKKIAKLVEDLSR